MKILAAGKIEDINLLCSVLETKVYYLKNDDTRKFILKTIDKIKQSQLDVRWKLVVQQDGELTKYIFTVFFFSRLDNNLQENPIHMVADHTLSIIYMSMVGAGVSPSLTRSIFLFDQQGKI